MQWRVIRIFMKLLLRAYNISIKEENVSYEMKESS